MDQGRTPETNRFIFSDAFYDQLGSEPEEKKVSFDAPVIPPVIETKKEEVIKEEVNSNFFNPNLQNDNVVDNNIVNDKDVEEKIEMPAFNFINPKAEPNNIISANQENVSNDNTPVVPLSDLQPTDLPSPLSEPAGIINNLSDGNNLDDKTDNFVSDSTATLSDLSSLAPSNQELNVDVSMPSISNLPHDDTKSVSAVPLSTLPSDVVLNQQDNLDVDSGIDTALEQEIMRTKVENQVKAPIVENNSFFKEPEEKQVYRARRNAPTAMPIWIQEEEKKEQAQIVKPEINLSLNNRIVTPPIINIDEEILKDSSNMDDDREDFNYEDNDNTSPVVKSTLLDELRLKEQQTGKISILARYGDDFCSRDYITNPAIGRKEEIKQLILILLTPEKSGILVGKPGIGKTSIVEGLAYQLQRNNVPDALKGYVIVSVKTTSLLGTLPSGETRLQTLIDELKELDKIILFIDEIHMLMGATSESSLDFANMFKESLGRGSIKMIGATTNDEYERYVLRDKAFVRRFQRVDVEEPTREQTIKILMGTLPKIEKNTGAKLKYSSYIQSEIMAFIVDITTEYKRVYGIGSRYPDICLTLLSQAFSQAVFDNRREVNIFDIRNAIENSKNIYPDVIRKELVNFDTKFRQIISEEKGK